MLHVSLLGEQAITDDATGTVRTRSSRAVALVAFLVVHAGTPRARQHIAGLFWPDSTDAQALTNLRRELHHLRQVLGDEPSLVVTSKDLCWRDTETCRVDVRTFGIERDAALAAAAAGDGAAVIVHATTAVAGYRGELVPGMYDDWLLEARSGLERQCVELCDLLCRTRALTGDLTGAADAARRRIQLQPLEEVGYRTLMQLQADLGDRAGAVSTYHHCASVLERELGIDPDPATRRTLQRLLARAPATSAPLPAVEPAAGRSGLAAARLFGRSRELGLLQDAVAGSRRGPPESRAGPRRCRRRQDPPRGRGRRRGAVAGRGGGEHPVLRSLQAAGAVAGGGLAAQPCGPVGDGDAGPGLAGRGRQAGALGRGARRAGDRLAGHGRRLATPPLLRGHGPGVDQRRPTDAAGPGQPAVVRPGDARVPHVLPGADHRYAGPGGRDAPQRQPRRRAGPRGLDREDAGEREAHGAPPRPVGGRRHGPSRRGDLGSATPAGRRAPAPGDDGRIPAVRGGGGTHHRRPRQRSAARR